MSKLHFFLILLLSVISCKQKNEQLATVEKIDTVDWSYAQTYYQQNMTEAVELIGSLSKVEAESVEAKKIFKELRIAFKKAEPYASYLNPQVGHRTNGPALPIFVEDTERILNPIGLQKIEESIYEGGEDPAVFIREVNLTKGLMVNLMQNVSERKLNVERFFIATHQQLLRIISLGISGFDTPVSQLGLNETIISLQSLKVIYDHTLQEIILEKNSSLNSSFKNNIESAIAFIQENQDFNTFDRYTFIRDYMNPITRNWVSIRKESGLWKGVNNKPFNFDAPTFFEKDAFNLEYFTPPINRNPSEKQIALGKKLFFDSNLSQSGTMACVTCHIPEKAYTDGLSVNLDTNGNPLQRNSPTLINAAFQKSFFWDGRAENILDQISSVFNNKQEFNTGVHTFSTEILKDTTYHQLFKEAFGSISKRNTDIIKAISSYISTLNGFDSKFDKNMRAEEDSFTEQEQLGMNLFMGKALCATCHFIPLTNGTVPPFYAETEKEVIGVPETKNNKILDDDLGFYWRYNKAEHLGMFKTPTVRNAEFTAPYMHNGIYNTLEEVMDFYNKGGGGGMGFDLEHQTLPFDELNLSEEELKALIAFVKTLSDTNVEEKQTAQLANAAL
ncbi:cytochrome-c peroxidase [Aurantibacter crassamenti]|uniref:cytochrome-c peroxidase n=1 Tax=Aurantibacter crassamenti TaxID=1837375 RepID=UPI001939647D|nr:cytochrome c peroxidase [Aurantibacter crassamenti]MBM1104665.1 cytochrome-c peroxidase [Aurantibacter crassamenti]